jgi:hypothetical protein
MSYTRTAAMRPKAATSAAHEAEGNIRGRKAVGNVKYRSSWDADRYRHAFQKKQHNTLQQHPWQDPALAPPAWAAPHPAPAIYPPPPPSASPPAAAK